MSPPEPSTHSERIMLSRSKESYMRILLTIAVILSAAMCACLSASETVATKTIDTDWCTITGPETAAVGEKPEITIAIKPGAISEAGDLRVDLHKFVGTERKTGCGHAPAKSVKVGEAAKYKAALAVPADAGAIIYVIYIMPQGKTSWSDKLVATNFSIKVQ